MTSPCIILHALLTRILSQIKSIVCVAAFPLPKKFRVQPSFFGSPFCINIICVVYQQFIYILNDIPLHHPARFACSNFITIKSIACFAAFHLPKKFRIQPSFFGNPIFAYITFGCNSEFRIPNYELIYVYLLAPTKSPRPLRLLILTTSPVFGE